MQLGLCSTRVHNDSNMAGNLGRRFTHHDVWWHGVLSGGDLGPDISGDGKNLCAPAHHGNIPRARHRTGHATHHSAVHPVCAVRGVQAYSNRVSKRWPPERIGHPIGHPRCGRERLMAIGLVLSQALSVPVREGAFIGRCVVLTLSSLGAFGLPPGRQRHHRAERANHEGVGASEHQNKNEGEHQRRSNANRGKAGRGGSTGWDRRWHPGIRADSWRAWEQSPGTRRRMADRCGLWTASPGSESPTRGAVSFLAQSNSARRAHTAGPSGPVR